jgi:hypothetical protein
MRTLASAREQPSGYLLLHRPRIPKTAISKVQRLPIVQIILDNYAAHKQLKVSRHPRFLFHFAPT